MHIETIKAIITNFYSTRKRNGHLHIGTYTTDQQRAFEKSFVSVLLAGRLIKGLPPRDEGKWRKKQNLHLRVEKPWRISAWNSDVTKSVKINRQYICIYEGFTRKTESVWYIYIYIYKKIYYTALSSTIEARLVWKLSIRSSGRADWKLLGRS